MTCASATIFDVPGSYRLHVPGLGVSYPFRIDDGIAACFARTYALGMYHQRCGMANELPFTRDTHGACHTAKAEVPNMTYTVVNKELADFSADYANNPRHTAPQLKNVDASLYRFVNTNKVDVAGGHYDAGDYSDQPVWRRFHTRRRAGLGRGGLFAATGDPAYEAELIAHYDPSDRNTRRFTWWRLFEGYGCAVRSYAFAARTGRLQASQLSPDYLAKCEAEIIAGADDQVRFAGENAYASSFPDPTKAFPKSTPSRSTWAP